MDIENKQPEGTVTSSPEVKQEPTSLPEVEMVPKADFDKLSNEVQMLKSAKMDELVALLYNQAQNTPAPESKKDSADTFGDWKIWRRNKNKGGQ